MMEVQQGTGFYGIFDRQTGEAVEEIYWRSREGAQKYLDGMVEGLDAAAGIPTFGLTENPYGAMHELAVERLHVAEAPPVGSSLQAEETKP